MTPEKTEALLSLAEPCDALENSEMLTVPAECRELELQVRTSYYQTLCFLQVSLQVT